VLNACNRWEICDTYCYHGGFGWKGGYNGTRIWVEGSDSENCDVSPVYMARMMIVLMYFHRKAIITLVIGNTGANAYKPDVYSPNIIIRRTIDSSGASSYKFRATMEGKIISHKREELVHMCQFFSITIDSPLTVLTQDAARSFLQSSDDEQLYRVS
jgi:hypothetical protein